MFRRTWIVAPDGQSLETHPATFGSNRAWTWRGAWRMARRYGGRMCEPWEVYGPVGKGDE